MEPYDKDLFWKQTVEAAQAWDSRFLKAVIAALTLKHGNLVSCTRGCHTIPTITISMEELRHIVANYNIGVKSPGFGILEFSAISQDYCENDKYTNADFDH